MADIVMSSLLVMVLSGIAYLGWRARAGGIRPRHALAASIICGVGLLVMLLSDWPTGWLSEFWAEHSVLAAVLTTVLTVGFAFMAYEAHDLHVQDRLHSNVSAAGMGGVVEPLAAVRRAIELTAAPEAPEELGADGRPLKWLSGDRLVSEGVPAAAQVVGPESWRAELVDQAIRRLAVAMRDWGPLIGTSRRGLELLESMGELRLVLMRLPLTHASLSQAWGLADRLVRSAADQSLVSADSSGEAFVRELP